ncbi:MAG: ROK family protein [Elusimicrobiota bacterium]
MYKNIVSIDCGATKMSYTKIYHNRKGRKHYNIAFWKKISTPVFKSYDEMVKFVAGTLPSKIDVLFIAVTGPVDEKKGVVYGGPNQFLVGPYPLKEKLSKALDIPVFVYNDVKLASEGEARYWRNLDNFLFVMAGTGIAVELVFNKKVVSRQNAGLGEIGHCNIGSNLRCNCGRKGCLETISSGWAIERITKLSDISKKKDLLSLLVNQKKYGKKFLIDLEKIWAKILEPILLSVPVSAIVTNGSIGLHPVFQDILRNCLRNIYKRHPLLEHAQVYKSKLGWKSVPCGVIKLLQEKG